MQPENRHREGFEMKTKMLRTAMGLTLLLATAAVMLASVGTAYGATREANGVTAPVVTQETDHSGTILEINNHTSQKLTLVSAFTDLPAHKGKLTAPSVIQAYSNDEARLTLNPGYGKSLQNVTLKYKTEDGTVFEFTSKMPPIGYNSASFSVSGPGAGKYDGTANISSGWSPTAYFSVWEK
jgi:hypothetical protein